MNTVYLNLPFQSCFSVVTDSERLIEKLSMKYGIYVSHKPAEQTDFILTVKTIDDENFDAAMREIRRQQSKNGRRNS